MRKQRKDSSRNRLTPEQQAIVESWLFRENFGYDKILERMRNEFGVEMAKSSLSRLYLYFARVRQTRELIEAHVRENSPGKLPASEDQRRAVAMTLATNAIFHASCARPGGTKELLPYLRLSVEADRNDIMRRKLNLTTRVLESKSRSGNPPEPQKTPLEKTKCAADST
jgi:hypothetical protein